MTSSPSPPIVSTIFLLVALAVAGAPLIQQLTVETIVRGLVVVAAATVAAFDLSRWSFSVTQRQAQSWAKNFVLDDVLACIFHPVDGVVAQCMGTFCGNFIVYSLPATPQQRAHLMQHFLWGPNSTTQQAERAFRQPGGWQVYLPPSWQTWLQEGEGEEQQRTFPDPTISIVPDTSNTNASKAKDMQRTPESVANSDSISLIDSSSIEEDSVEQDTPISTTSASSADVMLPSMWDILTNMARDVMANQFAEIEKSLPPHTLETTAICSAAVLGLQLRYSPRARAVLSTLVNGSILVGGSTTLVVSLLALLARPQSLTTPMSLRQVVQSATGTLPKLLLGNTSRKMKGLIAALVLMYFARTRRRLQR